MIWVNISNILYENKFSGIIRTEYELCCYAYTLKKQGKTISFCTYDKSFGFIKINDDVLSQRLTNLKNGTALEQKKLSRTLKFKRSFLKRINEIKYHLGIIKHPFHDNDVIIGAGQALNTNEMKSFLIIKKQINIVLKILCHDLMPINTPQFVFENTTKDFTRYIDETIQVANFFYCNSEFTKNELIDYYQKYNQKHSIHQADDITPPPMQVITLGCDLQDKVKKIPKDNSVSDLTKEPYLLFVSTIEIRKNHQLIYHMYLRLLEQNHNLPKIYFVGRRGWKVDDLLQQLDNDERIKNKIILLNNITDYQLLTLYQDCWFTLYPSFIEGYGLPVAESLSMGKYCLSSNAGALPEAGGEFIDYLSPYDLDAWCEKFLFLINNPQYIAQKASHIQKKYTPVSWQSFAKTILDNEL